MVRCRAHLSEAPEEPHRRLAGQGLLSDPMLFIDPFVTITGEGTDDNWGAYMQQLRNAGLSP